MGFVGPGRRDGRGGGATPWPLSATAALVLVAVAAVAGGLGDDFRWLGALALSEALVTRGRWRPEALRRRPWVRLGLKLGVGALALRVLGIAMPDASAVGWVFLLAALGCLAWLGLLALVGLDSDRAGEEAATMAVAGAVGLWFAVVGVPSSGWAALVAVLGGATALEWGAASLRRTW